MINAPPADGTRSSRRRWHLPPPLIHGSEPLEAGELLEEVAGELGLLLWQAQRDLLLWAETPAEHRAELFQPSAASRTELETRAVQRLTSAAPAVGPALSVLLQVVRSPVQVDPAQAAAACTAIAGWAGAEGHRATSLAFAQAAALALPADPATALAVGQIAAARGDMARAELWLRRTIGIARRARAWRPYSRAFSGLGRLSQDRGNLPAAHRFHLRALRGARRGGMRPEQAIALHDLFAVAVEAGRSAQAERYAQQAVATYPPHHPRVVVLAHDIAYFWMESGHFVQALPLFEALAPLIVSPVERLWAEANLMRAATGAGQLELADAAGERVRRWCEDPGLASGAGRAQLELARAELQLGRWDAAEGAARQALRSGRERREGRTLLSAEALLEAVSAARAAGSSERQRIRETPPSPPSAELTATLIQTLRDMPQPSLTAPSIIPQTPADAHGPVHLPNSAP